MVKRISEGKATYEEVEALSYRVGKDLGKVLQERLSIIVPEDGMVPDDIYEAILGPVLNEGHNMVIEAAKKVQENMNKAAGIGLKAQTADFDEDRARRLAEKLKSGVFKETKWVLDEPVANFHQSSADRTLRKNVKFQARAGLHPKITRKAEAGCCKWCTGIAGTYDYGDEPKDIYRRHERCRCVVDFRPGDGKRQNVWSKEWHEDAEPEEVENRIKREKELEEERKKKETKRKNVENNGIIKKLSDNEGPFQTVDERRNSDKKGVIKPRKIIKNLQGTEIGNEVLEIIKNSELKIELRYGFDNTDEDGNPMSGYYYPPRKLIVVFADETKTVMETAKTIVHEAFHSTQETVCQKNEVFCRKMELMHEKNTNQLTIEEEKAIINLVRKLYPDLPWE